jgi:hypothetical protein
MATMGFLSTDSNSLTAEVPLNDFKHALFIGRTGSGKTSGGINPVINSRIASGYGLLAFDEKGKEHKTIKVLARRHDRLEDVVEIGKPHGIRINLLEGMSERQLERFVTQLIQGDDNWMIGAVNLFMETVRWLRAIKAFYAFSIDVFGLDEYVLLVDRGMEELEKKQIHLHHMISTEPLTLSELGNYFKNTIDFTMISQLSDRFVDIIANKIKSTFDNINSIDESLQGQLLQADEMYEELEVLSKKFKGYRIKPDASEASGNNGIYFMIGSTIGRFANETYVNDPRGEDVTELLNQGKIIVINTESFGDSVLTAMLTKTLASLTVRAKKLNVTPVSVIIDEANRVLTPDSDLYVDILRESKCEIIMAAQGHEQLIIKMGEIKWASLANNFNTRFAFTGLSTTHIGYLNLFDERTEKAMEAKGMFFLNQDLDVAEVAFQKINRFYQKYKESDDEIAVYDHLLFESKTAILMHNLSTDMTREVIIQVANKQIKNYFFRNHAAQIVQDNESLRANSKHKATLTKSVTEPAIIKVKKRA